MTPLLRPAHHTSLLLHPSPHNGVTSNPTSPTTQAKVTSLQLNTATQHLLADTGGVRANFLVVKELSQATRCLRRISRVMRTTAVLDPGVMSSLPHKSHTLADTVMTRILRRAGVEGNGAAVEEMRLGNLDQQTRRVVVLRGDFLQLIVPGFGNQCKVDKRTRVEIFVYSSSQLSISRLTTLLSNYTDIKDDKSRPEWFAQSICQNAGVDASVSREIFCMIVVWCRGSSGTIELHVSTSSIVYSLILARSSWSRNSEYSSSPTLMGLPPYYQYVSIALNIP
jgi:hypothetical protein